MIRHEWRCVACKHTIELPAGETPLHCSVCGTPEPRRVYGFGLVWPRAERGH